MTAEEQAAAMELLRDPRLLGSRARGLRAVRRGGRRDQQEGELSGRGVAPAGEAAGRRGAVVVLGGQEFADGSSAGLHAGGAAREYTAMTGQALFYMGQKNLKHKILAIAEQQGAEARELPVETVAVGRQTEYRLYWQGPGERQACHA